MGRQIIMSQTLEYVKSIDEQKAIDLSEIINIPKVINRDENREGVIYGILETEQEELI